MKLLCSLTAHNRFEYTKKTIRSWLNDARPDDFLVVADNASTDQTARWLREPELEWTEHRRTKFLKLERNLFPGAATNIGWHYGHPAQFDLLMRSDNDIEYLPGWRAEVEQAFHAHPSLGQLGVLNLHEDYDNNQPVTPWEENDHTLNVNSPWTGGNCVIRRELWDQGLRWDSNPWRPGANEDTLMSQAIHGLGWKVARVIPTIANNLSFHAYDVYPSYYDTTAALEDSFHSYLFEAEGMAA